MKKIVIAFLLCLTTIGVFAQKSKGSFIVISKADYYLAVYDKDSTLQAVYPVALSKAKGNKQKKGDMKTPESPAGKPFYISMIQDASSWKHDFKDGRGSILSYGHWFMRLVTPGHSGIGIHGSTNNRSSVPGRASEGCIRMLDEDIIALKSNYAYTGMKVTIKHEGEDLYPWEKKFEKKLKAAQNDPRGKEKEKK